MPLHLGLQVVHHTDQAAEFVKSRYDAMEGISSFRKVVEEGPFAVKTLLARDATSGTLKSPTWVHISVEDEQDRSLDRFVLRDHAAAANLGGKSPTAAPAAAQEVPHGIAAQIEEFANVPLEL